VWTIVRLCAEAIVRNEADVIDAFVRHNLTLVVIRGADQLTSKVAVGWLAHLVAKRENPALSSDPADGPRDPVLAPIALRYTHLARGAHSQWAQVRRAAGAQLKGDAAAGHELD